MGRSGFSTSNYLSRSGAVVTATPLTLACWANLSSTPAIGDLICLGASGSLHKFRLSVNTLATIAANAQDAGGGAGSTTAGTITTNTWFHAAGVFASATSRTAYLNGTAATANTTSRTPVSVNQTGVGIRADSSFPGSPITGSIALVSIWNVALSAGEITSLALGMWPARIQRSALVAFYPIFGDQSPETDIISGNDLTVTGTLSQVTNPPTFYPPQLSLLGANW